MRKLLTTSALVVPLLAMPGYAQDNQMPADDTATQAEQLPPGTEDGAMTGADDANVEVIPAEEADVEVVREGEEPATEEPAMTAEEPMPATEGEMAQDEATMPPADAVVMEQGSDELRGDWVIGTTVVSPQDETIGQIQDVIITPDGQITSAVLSVGGFLGLGAKNIAVDWNELQISEDGQQITLNITREEAEQAPEYAFRDQQQDAAGTMQPEAGDMPDTAPAMDAVEPTETDSRSAPE